MKHQAKKKILSFFLCAVLAVTVLLLCVFAVTNEEFAVTYNGETAENVVFSQNEKTPVALQGVPDGAQLQWQIRMSDGQTWVDISGQTGETLTLSYALVASIMDQMGSTAVRCRAAVDGTEIITEPVEVQMSFVVDSQPQASGYAQESVVIYGDTYLTDALDTDVTVTVNYKYLSETGTQVFDSWVASLAQGVPFQQTVTSPSTQGYQPDSLAGAAADTPRVLTFENGTATLQDDGSVTFDLSNVTQDITVTVIYQPVLVKYQVKYYTQNVEDDLYTLYYEGTYQGYAGTTPDDSKNPENGMGSFEIPGFTRLYYVPETIAADGSTVFECYFDRNYYLINFELDGGYGVAPIYARYEDTVVPGDPVRPGYRFAGWNLVSIYQQNAQGKDVLVTKHSVNGVETDVPYSDPTADPLPSHIGKCSHGDPLLGNYTFRAIWTQNYTTYTVAYWIKDGDKNTYLGGRIESALSGETVYGSDDLGLEEGKGEACGYADHPQHTEECHKCGLAEHTHRVDQCTLGCEHMHAVECLTGYTTTAQFGSAQDRAAIVAIGDGEPQAGYVYALDIVGTNQTYFKLYLGLDSSGNEVWHTWNGDTDDTHMGLVYGEALGEATVNGYTAKKYVANLSCGHIHGVTCTAQCDEQEHTHGAACYNCGKVAHTHHEHTRACYFYWNNGGASEQDKAAIRAITNSDPESGYIYLVYVNENVYPKLLVDGQYYGAYESEIVGDQIGDVGTYTDSDGTVYTAKKYKARARCGYEECVDCEIQEHSHSRKCMPCGLDMHSHSTDCLQDTRHLYFVEADPGITVEGDGSTVVNVYYEYKTYTLKFYYAASKTEGTGDSATTTYYIVGGSTYFFGGQHGITSYDSYNDYSTIQMLDRMFDTTERIGQTAAGAVPTLNQAAKDLVTAGVYQEGRDSSEVSGRTYYYISFTARYGENIAAKWPTDILAPVEMLVDDQTGVDYTSPNWDKNYAIASAWNGEHHVWYSKNMSNETIKGKYEKLDYKVLHDASFPDSTTVSFLCFWENGAYIDWSVPELYVYNIWLQCPGNDAANAPAGKTTKSEDGIWYYLDSSYNTCDDSSIAAQTDPAITGYQFKTKTWSTYFISNTVVDTSSTIYRDVQGDTKYSIDTDGNTIVMSEGESYKGTLNGRSLGNEYYLLYNGDQNSGTYYDPDNPGPVINHTRYREAYAVDFYYTANPHVLTFWNYNDYLTNGTGVTLTFGTKLEKYEYGFEGQPGATVLVQREENYPVGLEPDAYVFEGWYTTADCYANTKVTWSDLTMPDSDLVLYAHWMPKEWKVTFYPNYEDYKNGNPYDWESVSVTHNTEMKSEDRPENPKMEGYTFAGWFYINEQGEKTAFNIRSMKVQQDMALFAEWSSKIPVTYTVYYQLEDGTQIAKPTTGYSFAGYTKTVTPKIGTELDAAYQSGYFPVVSSHSILMKEDKTQNVFTFIYEKLDEVEYTVRYLNAETLEELATTKTDTTKNAIITETAKLGTDLDLVNDGKTYIPQSFTEQLVLSSEKTENVITFYYVAADNTGAFIVYYHLQDLPGGTTEEYTQHTEHYYATAEGGTVIDALADAKYRKTFTGFELSEAVTRSRDQYSATIEAGKVQQLHLYYNRKSYSYTVKYMILNTTTALKDPETGTAVYGATVTETGTQTLEHQSIQYQLVTVGPQSLTVSEKETDNVIAFYYEPIKAVLQIEVTGLPEYCTDTFLFKLVGPTELRDEDSCIELTVAVQGNGVVTIGEMNGNDQVLMGLYAGTYEVTALTAWSYEYSLDGTKIVEDDVEKMEPENAAAPKVYLLSKDGNKITFTYTYAGSDWLGAETSRDNEFSGKYHSDP